MTDRQVCLCVDRAKTAWTPGHTDNWCGQEFFLVTFTGSTSAWLPPTLVLAVTASHEGSDYYYPQVPFVLLDFALSTDHLYQHEITASVLCWIPTDTSQPIRNEQVASVLRTLDANNIYLYVDTCSFVATSIKPGRRL